MYRATSLQVRSSRRWILFAALLGLPTLGLSLRALDERSPSFNVQSDTVVVYGPADFFTPNGTPQTYIETFTASVPTEAYQAIRIVNGPGDSASADALSVELNGTELITGSFDETTTILEIPVTLETENTLEIVVTGDPGVGVRVSAVAVLSDELTVYGPIRFTRQSGPPQWVTEHFSRPASCDPPNTFRIINGNPDGTNRISSARVQLNGVEVAGPSDFNQEVAEIVREVTLLEDNELRVRLTSSPGSFITIDITCMGGVPPVVHIATPAAGAATAAGQASVTGTVNAVNAVTVTVNGQAATVEVGNTFEATLVLSGPDGPRTIDVEATDAQGRTGIATRTLIRDTSPPFVTVTAPEDGLVTSQTSITVFGSVVDLTSFIVNTNGFPMVVDTMAGFHGVVSLTEGANILTVTAIDAAANSANVVRVVTRDTEAPVLTVVEPINGATTTEETVSVSGTVEDLTTVTVTANGQGLAVAPDGSFSGTAPVVLGPNSILITATDEVGNSSSETRSVTRTPAGPPDPEMIATPIIATESSLLQETTAFLYAAENPVQTGVAPGTIDFVRAAVIRGRVVDRALEPLAGVAVTIKGHPELGSTESRADGWFDMAVNGGGVLVLDFQKDGYLPAQRHVDAPWQHYALAEDVVLLQADSVVTVVDLTSPDVQIAQGSVQSDEDGPRQATVFFEPGTEAVLVRPDGTTDTLTSLAIRATEFTVGDNGPAAMPAELPPSSHYTYAVQVTADEQLAAGPGAVVTFSQPVPLYVENFLSFPVGTAVPAGVYDPEVTAWLPEPNGVVLAVVGTDAQGRALLDINGDGVPDSDSLLAFNGIDPLERIQLAGTYPLGSQLWRVPILETLPLDLNWGATVFGGTPPEGGVRGPCSSEAADLLRCELQAQTAFQAVGVVGSPFTLNYASDRSSANVAERQLDIALIGDTVPPFLERVDLQIDIAGRRFEASFVPEPNLDFSFTWDGLDAYGRQVQATQPAAVRIGFLYPIAYSQPAPGGQSFGLPCTAAPCELPAEITSTTRAFRAMRQEIRTTLGGFDAGRAGLGGFTFDVQHSYDPIGGQFYAGDGTRRQAGSLPDEVTLFLATGEDGQQGVGGLLVEADGSVYVSVSQDHQVWRVAPDQSVAVVAGTGLSGFSGDGGPATQARLFAPGSLARGLDGSLYISDNGNRRVRRIDPNGIITTFAGNGSFSFGGDGGPAALAGIDVGDLVIGDDGALLIADRFNRRIRRVGLDGIIRTFAGTGDACFGSPSQIPVICGEGTPATQARLNQVTAMARGPDGTLYFAQGGAGTTRPRIRKITPDGLIHAVAGRDGPFAAYVDGTPSHQIALIGPNALTVGPDGTVYLAHASSNIFTSGLNPPFLNHILRIRPDGLVFRLAGDGLAGPSGDNGPALRARVGVVRAVALHHDGSLLFDDMQGRIRRIGAPLPGLFAGATVLASDDGAEMHIFSPAGRILLTLDAVTGDTIYNFGYDAARQLVTITDRDGRVTTIQRDASGRATGVLAANGQQTAVTVDGGGRVTGFTGPDGESVGFPVAANGLLGASVDQAGDTLLQYQYDADGRLIGTTNAFGGTAVFDRDVTPDGVTLTASFGTGEQSSLEVTRSNGLLRAVGLSSDGTTTEVTRAPDGSVVAREPDGRITTVIPTPHPRFGMQAPLVTEIVELPSGLRKETVRRMAVVVDTMTGALVHRIDSIVTNGDVTTVAHDVASRRETMTSPDGRTRTAVRDSAGNIVLDSLPGVASVRWTYDARGLLTSVGQGPRTTTVTYDAFDRIERIVDPSGGITEYVPDQIGRPTLITQPDSQSVTFAYDPLGNLTRVGPPGRPEHVMSYGPGGVLAAYVAPDVGAGADTTRRAYDPEGRLLSIRYPTGATVQLTYDSLGRLESQAVPAGDTVRFTYDSTGALVDLESSSGVAVTLAYDGGLRTGEVWSGAVSGALEHEYDSDFRPLAQRVNGGHEIQFGYNGDGLPTTVGPLTLTYEPLTETLASMTLGQVATTLEGSALGDLSTIAVAVGGSPFYEVALQRDDAGRIVVRDEIADSDTTRLEFDYDVAGRLTTVTRNDVVTATYVYDANGNRTETTTGAGVQTASYDGRDRLLDYDGANYVYNSTGHLQFRIDGPDTTRYHYDELGGLRSVVAPDGTTIEYLLDGANRRVGRSVNGRLIDAWLYDGQLGPAAQLDSTGAVVCRFGYGSWTSVPDFATCDGTTYKLIYDERKSLRFAVDAATGDVALRRTYDAFGTVTSDSGLGLPFGFAGGFYDRGTELTRFGARDYDAATGRWTARDPIGVGGGDANMYAYVRNDPVNRVDPLGLVTLTEQQFTQQLRNILSGPASNARRLALKINKQLRCFVAETIAEEAVKSGVYIFLEGIGGPLAYVGHTNRFARREAEHGVRAALNGGFRALFQVDAADMRDVEQIVLNRTRSVLGLDDNHLRANGLRNVRGIGNIINPRRADLRASIKNIPYCS